MENKPAIRSYTSTQEFKPKSLVLKLRTRLKTNGLPYEGQWPNLTQKCQIQQGKSYAQKTLTYSLLSLYFD
jgi:hypothetical protein